jgi:hypothetical protein
MPKEDIAKRVYCGSIYHRRFQDMTMAWSISETVDRLLEIYDYVRSIEWK